MLVNNCILHFDDDELMTELSSDKATVERDGFLGIDTPKYVLTLIQRIFNLNTKNL